MLQVKNITKTYTSANFKQVALDNVSLNFRECEFVAILGQSGSGKTTFLNVVGGIDQYEQGDLVINGKSTKCFKPGDWDAYRNNSVGFIFQSYNLISHLSIMDNVEMGMTLSGVSSSEKRQRAFEVLERVGLKDHLHKKPNQLSGGQMQRVAIARALSNNPDIILADEPTGALDTKTSQQILDLIKDIAQDKLVIMVTHNPELAEEYADRIVRFSDGKIVDDSNPLADQNFVNDYKLKKTSMNFGTALKLSGKNIATKKWRTALTAFASSIGIIGIALVLSLSNGFDKQISSYETGTLSNYPITINQSTMNMDFSNRPSSLEEREAYPENKVIYPHDVSKNTFVHTNVLTQEYMDYLSNMDSSLIDGISYSRSVNMNLLKMDGGKTTAVNTDSINLTSYTSKADESPAAYLEQYYDLLSGSFPSDMTDLVLVVDEYNRLDIKALEALGFDYEQKDINLGKVIGHELKLIMNDDYYKKVGNYYVINGNASDLTHLYNSENSIALKISGIIRIKEDTKVSSLPAGLAYSDELAQYFIENAQSSEIVLAQQASDQNVITGALFSKNTGFGPVPGNMAMNGMRSGSTETKNDVLASLGATSIPASISLYPVDFKAKESILAYLDNWNNGLDKKNQIQYTDMAAMVTDLSGGIMDAITMVLVAFAAISLVVSMIMIGIIIYISVLERTKEIGVLRALGARNKDITRVFNAETFIIGAFSGLLGIGISYLLTFPVNSVLYKLTDLAGVAQLNPVHAVILVMISVVLTMIGGFIPAKMAAKKDPVEALRSE
jgi:ABC-type lipoprotein export system ATPase subunit/ABC-type antimicrobial peptide transport system permease subunit